MPSKPIPFQILELETSDAEAVYRALVALGNVVSIFPLSLVSLSGHAHTSCLGTQLHSSRSQTSPLDGAQSGQVGNCLRALPKTFPDERIQAVTKEIIALL